MSGTDSLTRFDRQLVGVGNTGRKNPGGAGGKGIGIGGPGLGRGKNAAGPPSGGGGTDPFFSDVSLLLFMDGADNGTVFNDSSANSFVLTRNASPVTKTDVKKYGTASGFFPNGISNYLQTPSNLKFAFGTGDFTVEFWIYRTRGDNDQGIFTFGPANTGRGLFMAMDAGTLEAGVNGGDPANITAANVITLNTWHHVALTRAGTSMRMFVDGVQVGSTFTASTDLYDQVLKIGYSYNENFNLRAAYLDEFRVTKGVARYTANFTPPSESFPAQ